METIYLSLRAQVAVGTFFMKSLVLTNLQKENWFNSRSTVLIDNVLLDIVYANYLGLFG